MTSIDRTRVAFKGPLTTPIGAGFRSINVALRQKYDLYANVRPAKTGKVLIHVSTMLILSSYAKILKGFMPVWNII